MYVHPHVLSVLGESGSLSVVCYSFFSWGEEKKRGEGDLWPGGVKKMKFVLASWMKSLGAHRGVGGLILYKRKIAFIKKRSLIWEQTTLKNFKHLNVQSRKEYDRAAIQRLLLRGQIFKKNTYFDLN